MPLHVRPERPTEFPAIHELVRLAFATAEHSDGDEHFLVDRLRQSPDYIPELALVAEQDGAIVGHILFTKVQVGATTALSLAPLSVLPACQRKGIGATLVRRGHELARELGWEFAVLVGHADYYPRFGYKPAASFGMRLPFEVPAACFMAINLQGGPEHLPGMVAYSAAFFPEATK